MVFLVVLCAVALVLILPPMKPWQATCLGICIGLAFVLGGASQ